MESAVAGCVHSGDERGREFIYKKFYGHVLAVTRRYVKNEFDAEELTNESFIRAFSKISSFNGKDLGDRFENSFRSWLSRIAVNISIDFIRAQKQFVALDDVNEQDLAVRQQMDAVSGLHVEDILKLLERLPDIQRAIFNMYEVEGYTHAEVSELLSIPESTSRTYLTRAKQKLRKLYLESVDITSRLR